MHFSLRRREGVTAGFEDGKESFASFGKLGVLKVRCGFHVTGEEFYDFHFMEKFSSG